MSEPAKITDFAEGLWEICPVCQMECELCVWCLDSGLVEHRCSDEDEE